MPMLTRMRMAKLMLRVGCMPVTMRPLTLRIGGPRPQQPHLQLRHAAAWARRRHGMGTNAMGITALDCL